MSKVATTVGKAISSVIEKTIDEAGGLNTIAKSVLQGKNQITISLGNKDNKDEHDVHENGADIFEPFTVFSSSFSDQLITWKSSQHAALQRNKINALQNLNKVLSSDNLFIRDESGCHINSLVDKLESWSCQDIICASRFQVKAPKNIEKCFKKHIRPHLIDETEIFQTEAWVHSLIRKYRAQPTDGIVEEYICWLRLNKDHTKTQLCALSVCLDVQAKNIIKLSFKCKVKQFCLEVVSATCNVLDLIEALRQDGSKMEDTTNAIRNAFDVAPMTTSHNKVVKAANMNVSLSQKNKVNYIRFVYRYAIYFLFIIIVYIACCDNTTQH